jgi:hypothetical protein
MIIAFLAYSSTLKMGAVCYSEISRNIHQTARRHIPVFIPFEGLHVCPARPFSKGSKGVRTFWWLGAVAWDRDRGAPIFRIDDEFATRLSGKVFTGSLPSNDHIRHSMKPINTLSIKDTRLAYVVRVGSRRWGKFCWYVSLRLADEGKIVLYFECCAGWGGGGGYCGGSRAATS